MTHARWEALAWFVIAVIAVVLSLIVTRDGVGIDADSAAYLGTADNVVNDHGISVPFTLYTDEYAPGAAAARVGHVPLTHFPPVYPLAVAAIASLGMDVTTAARVLGALLLGVDVVLIGLLARELVPSATVRSVLVALAAIGPVAGELLPDRPDRSWLFQHSQAMSESLYTALSLVTLLALVRFSRSPSPRWFALAIMSTALAIGTRFAGFGLAIAVAVTIVATGTSSLRRRIGRATITAVACATPVLLWEMAVTVWQDAEAPRSLHWPNRGPLGLARVFEGWLGLSSVTPAIRHVVLVAVVGVVVIAITRARAEQAALTILGGYTILFTVVVIATRAMVDASTPTDDRMFSPIQGVFYVVVAGAVAVLIRPLLDREPRASVVRAISLGLPLGLALAATPEARDLVRDGAQPEPIARTVDAADRLPREALIATNVPTQLWERSRHPSFLVPLRIHTMTEDRNEHFDEDVRDLVDVLAERRGYIVLLSSGWGVTRAAREDDFRAFDEVRVVRRLPDGVILRVGGR